MNKKHFAIISPNYDFIIINVSSYIYYIYNMYKWMLMYAYNKNVYQTGTSPTIIKGTTNKIGQSIMYTLETLKTPQYSHHGYYSVRSC